MPSMLRTPLVVAAVGCSLTAFAASSLPGGNPKIGSQFSPAAVSGNEAIHNDDAHSRASEHRDEMADLELSDVKLNLDGNHVAIHFSRPMIHPGQDPAVVMAREQLRYGSVTRIGPGPGATLENEKPVTIKGITIPAGTHALYLLQHDAQTADLIVSKDIVPQAAPHSPDNDLARVPMVKMSLPKPVDRLTIGLKEVTGQTLGIMIAHNDYAFVAANLK